MPPKQWDEEESDSEPNTTAPAGGAAGRRKFDDEEDDDDVLDSWDAADDSEAEREKVKKAEEAKAKAAAAAAAAKKPKAQRIADKQIERAIKKAAEEGDDEDFEDETPAERRERLRKSEQDADLAHAADMFGDIGVSNNRAKAKPTAAVLLDPTDPNKTVDIGRLPLFDPKNKAGFEALRLTLVPIISNNAKKAQYSLFLQDFVKALAKDLPSDQIKKIASSMTALGNEKLKEEKAAGGSKKTKAAKTKTSLAVGRANVADTTSYDDDGLGDDDFM